MSPGDEIDVDADTAFAGMSTVKIPILLKLYYDRDLPLDPSTSRWVSEKVKSETASNAGANALLRVAAAGGRWAADDSLEFLLCP